MAEGLDRRRPGATLRWSVSKKPAVATVATMALTLGLLYVAAALMSALTLAVSQPRIPNTGPISCVVAACLLTGIATVVRGREFPAWVYQALVGLGTVAVTAGVYLAGGGTASLAFGCIYIFVALDAFFFFAWPVATAHLVLLELCSTAAFAAVGTQFSRIILPQGCTVVVAIVVGRLARAAAAAETDPLTGLANLRGFQRATRDAIASAERSGAPLAIAVIDIDHFKSINDAAGPVGGDRILCAVVRAIAPLLLPGQILARSGGDAFSVSFPGCSGDKAAVAVDAMRAAAATVDLTCSAGVAQWRPGDSASTLTHRANAALLDAKTAGRARTAQYGVEARDCSELVHGLAQGQFELFYQPIIDFATGLACGDEALIRWRHPDRGLVPPDEFIPEAERNGAIHALGAWVLFEACRHAADRARTTGRHREIAVNVSGRELGNAEYHQTATSVLRATGIDPRTLTLEITETTLDADEPIVGVNLQHLRALGVQIAIDDFGTGYSNFTRLGRFPVDLLKIDKSFVDDIPNDESAVPILAAIVALARALNLRTVAEGIETEHQADVLRRIGCDFGQGYFYGRPQPADDIHHSEPALAGVAAAVLGPLGREGA